MNQKHELALAGFWLGGPPEAVSPPGCNRGSTSKAVVTMPTEETLRAVQETRLAKIQESLHRRLARKGIVVHCHR
jgi:hypothetical protein